MSLKGTSIDLVLPLPGLLYSVAAVGPQGTAAGFLSATRLEVPGVRVWVGIFQNHWGFKHVGCIGDGPGAQKSTKMWTSETKRHGDDVFFLSMLYANIWWIGWYISCNTYQNIANRLRFWSRIVFFVTLASSSKFYDGTSSIKNMSVILCLNAVDKYVSMICFPCCLWFQSHFGCLWRWEYVYIIYKVFVNHRFVMSLYTL